MPPPMSSLSALPSRLSMTPSLSETFEPPSTTTYGRAGSTVSRRSTSISAATRPPMADGSRSATSYTEACLRCTTPKPSETNASARFASCPANDAADLVVLAGLAGVEADVLEHGDLAVLQARTRSAWRCPPPCRWRRRRPGRAAHRAARPPDAGSTSGRARPSGRPRWATTTTRAPCVGEGLDRRHAGPDPAVVGDGASVERDVEVRADQDPLAPEVPQTFDPRHGAGRGQRLVPTWVIRSARRLE